MIIEALIDSGELARACQELHLFLSMTEPAELFVGVREQLVHNAGRALALQWLTSNEPTVTMTELLRLITAPDVVNPSKPHFPGIRRPVSGYSRRSTPSLTVITNQHRSTLRPHLWV